MTVTGPGQAFHGRRTDLQPAEKQRLYKIRPRDFTLTRYETVFFANLSALLPRTSCSANATFEKMSIDALFCMIVVLAYHA
jgi:hypothetical protein